MKPLARLMCFLAVALAAPALAELQTAQEIEDCVQDNMPDESSVQTIALRAKDRIGAITESRATIYWKKDSDGLSRLMMRFADPPDMRGAGLLLVEREKDERDMFMYLPELQKVKRITSRMMTGSMFGTDFTYEDFERFEGFDSGDGLERLEDAEVDGVAVYVIAHHPSETATSSYGRIVEYVDKERCIPIKTEFYERGDRLRKVATSTKLTQEGDIWIPRSTLLRDLRDETETELAILEVDVAADIPRKMFSQRELESGAHR